MAVHFPIICCNWGTKMMIVVACGKGTQRTYFFFPYPSGVTRPMGCLGIPKRQGGAGAGGGMVIPEVPPGVHPSLHGPCLAHVHVWDTLGLSFSLPDTSLPVLLLQAPCWLQPPTSLPPSLGALRISSCPLPPKVPTGVPHRSPQTALKPDLSQCSPSWRRVSPARNLCMA